ALCIYKNQDEPADTRFDKAIKVLERLERTWHPQKPLQSTTHLETLGLLGSIHKKKWIHDNQIRNLRSSRAYYLRAYQSWIELKEKQKKEGIEIDVLRQDRNVDDNGFNAINTIYVTDLLAYQDLQEVKSHHDDELERSARAKLAESDQIRKQIVHFLPKIIELTEKALAKDPSASFLETKLYWLNATMAEAYFGLHQFDEAARYLTQAKEIKGANSWEYETFARQLASLTQIHIDVHGDQSKEIETKAKEALRALLDKDAAIEAIFIGRVGLALSGGGFRASLFHIGVLARLAELGILRHIEVLSCVSGGSIIGAYYYLELKKLLESFEDNEITQQHYIDLVKRVEEKFLAGIQNNLRNRIFGSFSAVFQLIFADRYTTSKRLADLYEQYLYEPLLEESLKSLKMKDLLIQPKGQSNFNFKRDNWKRQNKISSLLINATPLNTGHNWQFTASWMGEAPGSIIDEVDAKSRLRRMYYDEAPGQFKNIQLGSAVAASSGVPGVIEPLVMDNLYKKDIKVQLVDGGVHDNQGIVGLLAQDCQVFLVSDASGQLSMENQRLGTMLSILTRSNNIMMERIRECQYLDLKSRLGSGLIKGMMFVHLRKELKEKPVGWHGMKEYYDEGDEVNPITSYKINKKIQRLLASVRTDLDTFNDREAYALMYSGYQMTKYQPQINFDQIFRQTQEQKGKWNFLSVAKEMGHESPSSRMVEQLTVSQQTFNKYLRFYPHVRKLLKWTFLLGTGALLFLAYSALERGGVEETTSMITAALIFLAALLIAPFVLRRFFALLGIKINTKLFRIFLTLFGVVLYLTTVIGFNWLYLQKGKIKKET
ncbi:MAG: patatin-like phospholipase family protein, partial [Bacteroidota bacterium]